MSVRIRMKDATAAGVLMLLTGCSGFFPPITTPPGGGGGGGGSSAGNFIYVANQTTNTIAALAVATSTAGAATLTAISGSPYAFPVAPTALVVTPNNGFLYAAGLGGLYAYTINTATGALTAVNSGGPVAVTNFGSVSLAVSPDGQWLFALSQDNATLAEYQINATTGALAITATPGYVAAGKATVAAKMVKVAPNGAYVFVALGTGGDLVFSFTTSTGVLDVANYQQLPTGDVATSDNALAVDSGTAFLYIARSGKSSGVAVYSIGNGGVLSPVAGSPFAAGGGPFSVVLDSTGKYVYAANRTDGTISGYSIGTGAVLTALAGSPYASGAAVTSLVRDNSTKYLVAAASNGPPDLTLYSFDATTAGKLDSATTAASGTDPAGAVLVVATH